MAVAERAKTQAWPHLPFAKRWGAMRVAGAMPWMCTHLAWWVMQPAQRDPDSDPAAAARIDGGASPPTAKHSARMWWRRASICSNGWPPGWPPTTWARCAAKARAWATTKLRWLCCVQRPFARRGQNAPMNTTTTSSSAAPLASWAALVRKDGVGLGLLPQAQQRGALALVWSVLPQGAVLSEPQVNQQLKAALAGAVVCLDTDHVELRRWLVDAGWLQRDGFGREYRACSWDQLTTEQQATAAPLHDLDTGAWVAQQRAAALTERASRRASWLARKGT